MKRSPIQLLQSTLLKISLEPVTADRFDQRFGPSPFEYEKVVFETAKSCSKFPEYWTEIKPPVDGLVERTYYVQLGVRTPLDGEDIGPYRFEVVCSGVVVVMPGRKMVNSSDDDIALQYGLTMLYGAIREQISTLTSKMTHGQAMLPTLTFLDEKFGDPKTLAAESEGASLPLTGIES